MSIGNAAGTVTIPGNLTVSGTTTTLDTQTLLVEDKNITIGNVITPTDVTAAGGGITLLGATNKTITWNNATDGWELNQPLKVTGNIVTSGDLAVNDGDITTTSASATLFNTNATAIDIGNGATSQVNIGNYTSGTVNIKAQSLLQNDLGGAISTTFNLFNSITTDLNIGGAATTVDIGNTTSSTTTIGYDAVVNHDLTVTGDINVSRINIDNQATINTATLTTTATGAVPLTIAATRNAMTGLVNIIQGTNVHCVNVTVLRVDATTAMLTTYGEMYNNISLASFSADVNAGDLRLLVNPTSATSTVFSVVRTSLT
jgi:hypothetical protein